MALSTDIRLPKDQPPEFPWRCVRCLAEPPTHMFRVNTNAIGWWSFLLRSGAKHTVEVPACERCWSIMWRQRVTRFVITIVLLVAGVWLATRVLGSTSSYRRWIAGVIALAACAPWFLWQVFVPPAFDVTAYAKHVDYEFTNEEYADEFLRLNNDD